MIRYASDLEFTNNDVYKVERQILALFQWKIRFTTVYDLVEHYLYQGIIFSDEELQEDKFQIKEITRPSLVKSKEKCVSVPDLLVKKPLMKFTRRRGILGRSINVLKKMFFKTLSEKEPLKSFRIPFCVCPQSFEESLGIETFNLPYPNNVPSDDRKSTFSNIEITEFISNLEKNTLLLVRVIQMDNFYWKYNEKIIAAALIAYVRKQSGFEPFW
jgi:hypothetical protein